VIAEPPPRRRSARRRVVLAALLAVALLAAGGVAAAVLSGGQDRPGWALTFSDEFEGDTLDEAKWSTNWGRSNEALTHYLRDRLDVDGGHLRISAVHGGAPSDRPWSSGLIMSRDSHEQRYGRFEMRAKVPAGQALWPAFWLLPKGAGEPEIDVMEHIGQEPNRVYMTVHGYGPEQEQRTFDGPDFTAGYHTYAVEWTEGLLVWKIDGVERFRTTRGVPDMPMYLIANLAVGYPGDPSQWVGAPDDSTPSPAYMDIDWIRAYAWR